MEKSKIFSNYPLIKSIHKSEMGPNNVNAEKINKIIKG